MKSAQWVAPLGLLLVSVCLRIEAIETAGRADYVFHNGVIWTGETLDRTVQALAVRDNKIVASGSNAELLKWVDKSTQKVDLRGRLVTPGFNDAHIHFLNGSHGLNDVELTDTHSAGEVYDYVRDYAVRHPQKSWIVGRGWQYAFFEGGFPDRAALDRLLPDRPAYIRAYDGHTAWVNSKALQMAGINRQTVFTGFGEIGRSATGEPNGILKEDAMELVSRLIPPRTRDEHLAALKTGMKHAAEYGITSLQNASGSVEEAALYETLLASKELSVRVGVAFNVDDKTTPAQINAMVATRDRIGLNHPFLKANAVKFLLDGIIEGHTAAMLQAFDDVRPDEPSPLGQLAMPYDIYAANVALYDRLGFQIYTHATGDRGVRESLNAYEQAMKQNATRNRRHRIEHIETVNPADLPRFAALGVLASMEPIHAEPDTLPVWEKAIGAARLSHSFAWRELLTARAALVFSSDWPACVALDPIRGLHVAVTRQTIDGRPQNGWVSQQKLSMKEALYAYTVMGAYSSSDENWKGQLKPGYVADLVVHSHALLEQAAQLTHQNRIDLTMVDGKIIFERQKK